MDVEKTKGKIIKKRNWAFIAYPSSAPSDWIEKLKLTGLRGAISPLHDKDVDPTEEEKGPHWHVIITYDGPQTFNAVKTLTGSLNATIPLALDSIRGYYRYFTHKDNPDKYQYDEKEIKTLNGFNINDFVELTKSEVNEITRRLQIMIRENNICEYCELMDYLLDYDMYSEHDVASSHTYFFDRYITSRRFSAMEQNGQIS